ncbi:MAG: glycosyltransferase family 2 protein, partial [Deltaproteobacteria bacterium]|nr:glycosyltransferase family 2 protein [Deltaproteobacteria bacterium]
IIIVDDGSTDDTLHIAREFESGTVKVLSQPNSGACTARNAAFSVSQGDFIQWLDSDDLLAPDKIEIQLSDGDTGPETRVLHSAAWGRFYCRLMGAEFSVDALWQDLYPVDWLLFHIDDGYMMQPAAWLGSRRLSELAGSWDERLVKNQDGEYFCRVVASSELVRFHPKARSYYRRGDLSSTSYDRSKKAVESLDLSNYLSVEHLLNLENNELTREASIRFLQRFVGWIRTGEANIGRASLNRIAELGGVCTPPSKPAATWPLRLWLWNSRITVRKNLDRLFAMIDGDGV